MNINPKILLALKMGGAAAGVAGVGAGGYYIGQRKGARRMGDALTGRFNEYNQQENQHIAQQAYLAGLTKGESMDKSAYLNAVRAAAFDDEMDKIAGMSQTLSNVVNKLKGSFGAVKRIPSEVRGFLGARKNFATTSSDAISALKEDAMKQWRGKLKQTAMESLPAIGITGAGLAGAGLGSRALLSKESALKDAKAIKAILEALAKGKQYAGEAYGRGKQYAGEAYGRGKGAVGSAYAKSKDSFKAVGGIPGAIRDNTAVDAAAIRAHLKKTLPALAISGGALGTAGAGTYLATRKRK